MHMRIIPVVLAIALMMMLTTGCRSDESEKNEVRIGYQKFGVLSILKARKTLEERLESQGFKDVSPAFSSAMINK